MNYTISNTIDCPIEEVIEKFKDPNGLVHWMEGLQLSQTIFSTQFYCP